MNAEGKHASLFPANELNVQCTQSLPLWPNFPLRPSIVINEDTSVGGPPTTAGGSSPIPATGAVERDFGVGASMIESARRAAVDANVARNAAGEEVKNLSRLVDGLRSQLAEAELRLGAAAQRRDLLEEEYALRIRALKELGALPLGMAQEVGANDATESCETHEKKLVGIVANPTDAALSRPARTIVSSNSKPAVKVMGGSEGKEEEVDMDHRRQAHEQKSLVSDELSSVETFNMDADDNISISDASVVSDISQSSYEEDDDDNVYEKHTPKRHRDENKNDDKVGSSSDTEERAVKIRVIVSGICVEQPLFAVIPHKHDGSADGGKAVVAYSSTQKKILAAMPDCAKDNFNEICWVRWDGIFYPALIISPFDLPHGAQARENWMSMFCKFASGKNILKTLVYYYECDLQDKNAAFSLVDPKSIVSYDEGLRRGFDDPNTVSSQRGKWRKLAKAQKRKFMEGVQRITDDAALPKENRGGVMFFGSIGRGTYRRRRTETHQNMSNDWPQAHSIESDGSDSTSSQSEGTTGNDDAIKDDNGKHLSSDFSETKPDESDSTSDADEDLSRCPVGPEWPKKESKRKRCSIRAV